MKIKSSGKPLVFEGVVAEQYKAKRNKWIRLSIIGTALPFVFAIFVSWYVGKLDFLELFGNGEIILSLFSLTIPTLFDMFEIKKNDDEKLSWMLLLWAILICAQSLAYGLVRIDTASNKEIKSIVTSVVLMIASWFFCRYSIKTMFVHSLNNGGENDE